MPLFFDSSEELNAHVARETGGVCILSFSYGKDSIAAWLELRRHFHTIVPVYMYPIPGLEFVEQTLRYFEDFFGTHIVRMPSPSLYRKLRHLIFQAPENCAIVEDAQLIDFTYDDIFELVRQAAKLAPEVHVATGVRAVDSPDRWAAIKKYGAINESRRQWYPVYDWRKDRLINEIRQAGITLPVDYQLFGRSWDGIDYRFLKPIRDRFPRDYARILEWFPMVELELKRIEYRERYYREIA